MKKIYSTLGMEAFWKDFEPLIKFPMVVYNREPAVERTIDFIAKFVTSLSKPAPDGENQASDDESNPLLLKLFDFLLQHHNAAERAVRFRACQLITKLLANMGEEATIDDALYERVFHCMLERLRDKAAVVRVHAVLALVRLQDPIDETCPVIKAYIFLMTCDPNPEVRKTIVTHIALCRLTLSAVLERTRDVKDTVRQAAFTVIADKVPIKALSISQRVQLLQQGLNDRTEAVRVICRNKLLQSWLRTFEGNVLDLLHSLDAESSTDICQRMLQHLFADSQIVDLISDFTLLDDKFVVKREKLTCESAMYWQELCCHVHKAGPDYEENLDMILPSCLEFCTYLDSVVEELRRCQDLDQRLELEFVIQQLLLIFNCMDLADQACWKTVEKLLHKMLLSEHVGFSLVEHLLPCLRSLHSSGNNDTLVNYLAEVVAEIRQPITTVEKGLSDEERRNIDVQVAKVRVHLNQAKEELEQCVKNQEFERAAALKASIHSLEIERSTMLSAAEPIVDEIRTEKNDAVTMVKCMTIICEMLQKLPLQTLTPTLQMLMENEVLPGMSNQEASVRNLSVKAIGICCQLKKDLIKFHLPLLLQASQVDVECVRITAVKSLFDLVHIYGLSAFEDADTPTTTNDKKNEDENDSSRDLMENTEGESRDLMEDTQVENGTSIAERNKGEHSETSWSKTATNLISILSSMLDNESGELQCTVAEGLAKLLLSRRVFSAGLLSRLLLLWYNPLEEDNAPLRNLLGTFFPILAFTDSGNQQLFEEAFLPTLRTILNAPTTSPLSRINVSNVAEFFVELTHVQRLVSSHTSSTAIKDNPCHDSMAVKVCNEILSSPQSLNVRMWSKVLNLLDISPDNSVNLKDLSVLCTSMMEVVKEKACIKTIEKFQKMVSELVDRLAAQESATVTSGEGDIQSSEAANKNVAGTPPMPPPQGLPLTAKLTARKARRKNLEQGDLDQSDLFSTPSQREALDRTAGATELANVRANLDSLLLETSKNATPKSTRSKRALHTIQEPSFL